MKSLGQTIRAARELMGLTLRQVEEATQISNAYLSQLENDKIKKPSASVLYKLANVLNVELDNLLAASGIIEQHVPKPNKMLNNNVAFSAQALTPEEEEELLNYLQFIRSKKS